MFDASPSIAALLVPFDASGATAFVARGMQADGYKPTSRGIPRNERAFPLESVSYLTVDAQPISVIAVPDIARVFELACTVSKASPDVVIVAFRRFAGSPPVVKVVFGGKPQWKDGNDPDHEVFFDVPDGPSSELRIPSPIRVPTAAAEIALDHGATIARVLAGEDPGARASHWLHRRSQRRPT